MSWLKPLRRPRLWLGLWWLAIAGVVVLSLAPAPQLAVPAGSDKLGHALTYAALAAAAVQLFRREAWVGVAVALVALGLLLEGLQFALTTWRSLDGADALANAAGVLAGTATGWSPWRDLLLQLERGRGR